MMRLTQAVLIAVLAGTFCFGCSKEKEKAKEPARPAPAPAAALAGLSGGTVAQVHWLGKKRLAAETNSADFMQIWNLPETARLEAQTLDKLSVAPWRGLSGATTNASALLRPLLDDLVQEECYLEISQATNQPAELALAIRMDETRAVLWQANLAGVLESLTHIRPVMAEGHGSLTKHDPPNLIEWTRVGEWLVVGAGQQTNSLLGDFAARIRSGSAPYARRATNYWLEADLDLRRTAKALSLSLNLPEGLPEILVNAIGDGKNVRTRGEFRFSDPVSVELEPWNIPTNHFRGPLASFIAVRGFEHWLASTRFWQDLQIGSPPSQFFVWSYQGVLPQTHFSATAANGSNFVHNVSERLVQVNPWLATNGTGNFEQSPDNGVIWKGVGVTAPNLQWDAASGGIVGGLFPNAGVPRPFPPELAQILSETNLLVYDWEFTGIRLEQLLYIGQAFRVMLHKPQLAGRSTSVTWFKAAATNLQSCVTELMWNDPRRFSFIRRSSVGFNAMELSLLADWLESPEFPRGFHTLVATNAGPIWRRPGAITNAPAAQPPVPPQ